MSVRASVCECVRIVCVFVSMRVSTCVREVVLLGQRRAEVTTGIKASSERKCPLCQGNH